ncbi:RagB/SusD family nutrient uptake outer membrane protein [Pedobacter sp. MC2016-14]|uniref:RagB/SusD family nutrient uptake outer membrane protein n=1 Tax=Pedobacter sp. MC2016-14 TaxID=2897327 RepID=UPI001E58D944|nr:RagB/SusD family nutrient uptake outer membrane protein [Pedobacter sp. MC2016-14]MCD0489366.1 RagB/SusD family nutrient uptake outer membrane protein [Pedobacter sp. MC2016-14]
MKIKYIILCAVMPLLTVTSCKKDFLDRNPLNSVSDAAFWKSETDVKTALAGVYSRLQQNFLGYERVYLDALSDNAFAFQNTNQPFLLDLTTGSISPGLTGALPNMMSSPYRAITSCNYFLDNIDKAPISDTQKNGYVAQVRFIRALAYFDLVQTFGGVPLNKHYPKTVDEVKIPQSTKAEVYAFINEDLDFAIANLPDVKYTGYAVKGSAQGIKARVLITQQRWGDAVVVLKQIMTDNRYALSNNYAALFKTSGQATASVNTEIMFSTQYQAPTNPQRTSPGAAGMDIELGWFSLIQPYKDLIDDYEMTDGKMPSESALYNPLTPYINRDPRLDLTVKLPNEVWSNSLNVVWNGYTQSSTGFLMEKYVDLSRAPFTSNTAASTDQDYIHLRYADILLMYAEAQNEVGGPDATVYKAIDDVRGRVGIGMPPVDRVKYDLKDELRDYIRHERRIEFALEGQRYNDLKRWNIAHIKLPTLKSPAGTPLVFSTKNYLLPFPSSELDNNPQLKQNDY